MRTDCCQHYARPAKAAAATLTPYICRRPTQMYSRHTAGADALSLMMHSARAVSTATARATVRRRRGSCGPWRCTSSLSTPSTRWASTVSLGPCNGLDCPHFVYSRVRSKSMAELPDPLEAPPVTSRAEAVPKRILDLMNVEGLTRENVASHLQVWSLLVCSQNLLMAKKDCHNPNSNCTDHLLSTA